MINRDRLAINTHLRSLADGSMRAASWNANAARMPAWKKNSRRLSSGSVSPADSLRESLIRFHEDNLPYDDHHPRDCSSAMADWSHYRVHFGGPDSPSLASGSDCFAHRYPRSP